MYRAFKQFFFYLLKGLFRLAIALVCLAVFLISSLHLFLITSEGQIWVAYQIEKALKEIEQVNISFESIKPTSPRTIRIEGLKVYNREKELAFEADKTDIQLSLMQILKARMPLSKISSSWIEINFDAIKKWEIDTSSSSENFDFPSILLSGNVTFEIDHISCLGDSSIPGLKAEISHPLGLYCDVKWNPLFLKASLDLIEKKDIGSQPQLSLNLYHRFGFSKLELKIDQVQSLSLFESLASHIEFFKDIKQSNFSIQAESQSQENLFSWPPKIDYRYLLSAEHQHFSEKMEINGLGSFDIAELKLTQNWNIEAPSLLAKGKLKWDPIEYLTTQAEINLQRNEKGIFPHFSTKEAHFDLWLNTYNGLGRLSFAVDSFQYKEASPLTEIKGKIDWLSPTHIFANLDGNWLTHAFNSTHEFHRLGSGGIELDKVHIWSPSFDIALESDAWQKWNLKTHATRAILSSLAQEFQIKGLSIGEVNLNAKVNASLDQAPIEGHFQLQLKEASLNQMSCRKLQAKGSGLIDLSNLNQSLLSNLSISSNQIWKDNRPLVDLLEGRIWGNPKAFFYNIHVVKDVQFEGLDDAFDLESQGIIDLGLIDRIQGSENQRPFKMAIDTLNGSCAGLETSFTKPCVIVLSKDSAQIQNFHLDIGQGLWKGWAHISPEELQISSEMTDVPANILQILTGRTILGTASGLIELDLRPHHCQAQVDLDLRRLRLAQTDQVLPPVDTLIKVDWHQSTLNLTAKMSNVSEILTCHLNGKLIPPASFGLWGDLQGNLDLSLEGKLGLFSRLFTSESFDFDGKASGRLHLEGSINKPSIKGEVSIQEGSYDHYSIGLALQKIKARLIGRESKIILDYLDASDGAGGSAHAYGELSLLNQTASHSFVKIDNLRFLHIPYASARADGEFQFLHKGAGTKLKGEVELREVDVRIPDQLPSPVPQLESYTITYDINPSVLPKKSTYGSLTGIVEFDLLAKIPKATVKGRGLDSSWQGEVHLKGDEDAPLLKGHIDLVSGEFEFADKRFLVKEGNLIFTGNPNNENSIHMIAEATIDQITLRAILNGPIERPRLQFRSTPNLPMADFFSYLLFSKSHSSLNAFQAFQVAQIALEASGESSLGLMSQLRKNTGIDRLELSSRENISSDHESDMYTLKVGKYLAEGFLVGVSKDVSAEGTQITFELDLTKHLSLITEIGYLTNSSINLLWKKEY